MNDASSLLQGGLLSRGIDTVHGIVVHLIVKESDATLAFEGNEPRGNIVTIELNEASAPEAAGPPAATVGGANAP